MTLALTDEEYSASDFMEIFRPNQLFYNRRAMPRYVQYNTSIGNCETIPIPNSSNGDVSFLT